VTSGGAALDAVQALREAGLTCETAVCVVDREEGGADEMALHGVKLRSLYVAEDLLSTRKTAANPHI
jgi:orotate phosphoribosyltransferase